MRRFAITSAKAVAAPSAIYPLYNGGAMSYALSNQPVDAEYWIGNPISGGEAPKSLMMRWRS
jgi:hypothetical protein